MTKAKGHSAGLLFYRRTRGGLRVLLVHPGGPWWRGRDAGAWQIAKGLIAEGEGPEAAARREGEEELGVRVSGTLAPLGTIVQAGGKRVEAYAVEQEIDADAIRSNRFELEWPPGSGRIMAFPEVDAARWMTFGEARRLILPSQRPLLGRLRAACA